MELLQRTLELAEGQPLSREEIREFCDSIGVTPRWYSKVISRETVDPGVTKIQRLHDYLSARSKRSKGRAA